MERIVITEQTGGGDRSGSGPSARQQPRRTSLPLCRPRARLPGCPRESRPWPKTDGRAGSLPAPSPGPPAFCCSPLLHAGGLSTAHQSRGPGLDRGPPPETWLSLGGTPPQGLRGSCGLSLPPVAPSLVTLHQPYLSIPALPLSTARVGRGPAPLCFWALGDRVHTPPKAKRP